MKNILINLRKKLDLDNKGRYQNGYYQLSRKQKNLWVFGLFLTGFLFSIFRVLLVHNGPILNDALIISATLSSLIISLVSFFVTFLILYSIRFSKVIYKTTIIHESDTITKYILWTVFFFAILLQIVFKVKMPFIGVFFH